MEPTDPNTTSPDEVDKIVAQWRKERPGVDVSGMEIIGRLSRLEKRIRPRLEHVFARHELESWEFDVLATLLRNGTPYELTPGQLLESMMITSGTMTNRIDRLESRGLVSRTPSASDGRKRLIRLTEAGRQKADRALIDHASNEADIINALAPQQQAQLIELLRVLNSSAALAD